MTRIGIMQGRLVPPVEQRFQCFPRTDWRREFALAAQVPLDAVEWIYDGFGADVNPLASAAGIDEMRQLSDKHGVAVRSVCADYFMEKTLVRADAKELQERMETLSWLLDRCRRAGIERIVLPFVDASRIENERDLDDVVAVLQAALPAAERAGVEIHLETALAPAGFTELLKRVPHPFVKVNYDSGNSASLGFDVCAEFAAYGARVGSVHIKDRVKGGGTVPLGTGAADFQALFECLDKIDYAGDLILQAARSVSGEELAWARQNRAFVMDRLH